MSRNIQYEKMNVTRSALTLNIDEREMIAKSFWSGKRLALSQTVRERARPAS